MERSMNEQIKELVKIAEQYALDKANAFEDVNGDDEDYDYSFDDDFQEKFAELLVKKCAYLVNDQQRTTGYTTHAQMLCREFGIEYKDEDYYGVEPHTCPYKTELYDGDDTLCICDPDQEYQCAMDI